jgi:hypothetical protein
MTAFVKETTPARPSASNGSTTRAAVADHVFSPAWPG